MFRFAKLIALAALCSITVNLGIADCCDCCCRCENSRSGRSASARVEYKNLTLSPRTPFGSGYVEVRAQTLRIGSDGSIHDVMDVFNEDYYNPQHSIIYRTIKAGNTEITTYARSVYLNEHEVRNDVYDYPHNAGIEQYFDQIDGVVSTYDPAPYRSAKLHAKRARTR